MFDSVCCASYHTIFKFSLHIVFWGLCKSNTTNSAQWIGLKPQEIAKIPSKIG